jgi:hypothetical protein
MSILFLPSSNPSVKLMSNFAEWISAHGQSVAIVANNDQQRFLKSMGVTGYKILDFKTLKPVATEVLPSSPPGPTSTVSRTGGVATSLSRRIAKLHSSSGSLGIFILAMFWVLQIFRFRWLWRREVAKLYCDVAFVWWDNAGTTNGELINLLKARGAKVVHLPVALSDQKIIARLRADSEVMQIGATAGLVSRALAYFYPDQVLNFESRRLFFYHPSEILAMALLGALPPKPWVLGASRADIVCFADINQRDYWVNLGLDASMASIVGNLDLQDIALDIARLCRNHTSLFEQSTPLVLINMPNLVEHNVLSDWDSLWVHVRKMFAPFNNHKVELVVNLHPKSDSLDYAWLTQHYGCLVTQGDIGAWIGLADLYVSLCSSTETIASDFGVAVLDIGLIFGFESEVLKSLPNITFLNSYQAYETAVQSKLAELTDQPRRFHAREGNTVIGLISPYDKIKSIIDTELNASC